MFWVTGLKILGRVGTNFFFWKKPNFMNFERHFAFQNASKKVSPKTCIKFQFAPVNLGMGTLPLTQVLLYPLQTLLYPPPPPPTLFVVGILFSRCPCVCLSVTLCYLNIFSHCWILIKPCKHVYICKTNTSNKKVRARGQFYYSYFRLYCSKWLFI